jgi:pantoate--beta-alanine ligase
VTEQVPEPDSERAARSIVASTRSELATSLAKVRADGGTLALVPTMGALHAGHRSLLVRASEVADVVAVSIFVNPLQFGATEDLSRYPRSLEADVDMCTEAGVGVVFAPELSEMYPAGDPQVRVAPGRLGDVLEGAVRPGHFDGVLTVVTKLFGMFRPDFAVFGEKDAQQLLLVRRMVDDLDLPVRIVAAPVFRDPDGLAMSSRNRYLDAAGRTVALALSRSLVGGREAARSGSAAVLAAARRTLDEQAGLDVDYCVLARPDDLTDLAADATGAALLLVAGRVGGTRLIDVASLVVGEPGVPEAGTGEHR